MPGHSDPREALIRAAIALRQAGTGITEEHDATIRRLFAEITAALTEIDPTGPSQKTYRELRYDKLIRRVEGLLDEHFADWRTGVRSDVARLGRAHGQQITADLVASLGPLGSRVKQAAPTINMLKAVLDTDPFGQAVGKETLGGWVELEKGRTLSEVRRRFQAGMVEEWSIGRFVEELTGGMPGRKAIITNTRRNAETIVRSAVTHVATEAQIQTYTANPRVVSGLQFVATLDSRTCPICGDLDATVWPLDGDPTRPPVHLRCRCALVPVVDWDGLGLDPPEGGARFARDQKARLEGKTRGQQRTQVPASTDYEGWLRDQPREAVVDILGPGRAELFLGGDVSLADMIGRDRRILRLDELE